MNYRQLGKTDLRVSEIALGSWVFGAKNWGQVNDQDSEAVIRLALDKGINIIDTAPIYGIGHAEEVIGRAIASKRDKVFLATKCGLRQTSTGISHDLSAEFIEEELINSLRRLQTDYIDLYQVHWPDPHIPTTQVMETLLKLQEKGLIRHIGLCNHPVPQIKEALQVGSVACIQHQYSMLERSVEDALVFVQQEMIGFMAYGVLHAGLLSGKYKSKPEVSPKTAKYFFYKMNTSEIWEKYHQLGSEITATQAVQWVLNKKAVSTALVGFRNIEQLLDCIPN